MYTFYNFYSTYLSCKGYDNIIKSPNMNIWGALLVYIINISNYNVFRILINIYIVIFIYRKVGNIL